MNARCDVAVVGGGIAGLWTLRALEERGCSAVLIEADALGRGQSVASQGIVHGGGKYALRSVTDLASMRAIRDMPDRWREHLNGRRAPSLESARMRSEECWMWLPRGSFRARLAAAGLLPLLRHTGVLACPPQRRPRAQWPSVLRRHALRADAMAEPVLDTVSVLRALATGARSPLARARIEDVRADASGDWIVSLATIDGSDSLELRASAVVCTAGLGNGALLRLAGLPEEDMQRRPLRMFLVRGMRAPLYGHCIDTGRTRITVTAASQDDAWVWQIGGEVAERNAALEESEQTLADARKELQACLPGLNLEGVEWSSYAVVRAEGRHPRHRRPSGVQWLQPHPGLFFAWPTKWAMAPLLAEELAEVLHERVRSHAPISAWPGRWPRPEIARPPWEEVERRWRRVDSGARV